MDNQQAEPLKTYTVQELVKVLKISQNSVLKLLREGTIKGAKVGRVWRVSAENLRAFINGEQ